MHVDSPGLILAITNHNKPSEPLQDMNKDQKDKFKGKAIDKGMTTIQTIRATKGMTTKKLPNDN